MRRDKVYKFSAFGSETPSIPLKNSDGVREEKRKQELKGNSQEHEAVVREQRENIRSWRRGIRGLKVRVGRSVALTGGGQVEQWRYTSWRIPRRKSQCW